jgi:hypothetical protein
VHAKDTIEVVQWIRPEDPFHLTVPYPFYPPFLPPLLLSIPGGDECMHSVDIDARPWA